MITIRNYEEKDRLAIRDICKETAWADYKSDEKKLETVPIMFADYFMDYEPDYIFVASDGDKVVGYIECATDYKQFVSAMKKVYRPKLKEFDKNQVAFINKFLLSLWCIRKQAVHFHMNITNEYQRKGIGTKLLDTLTKKLKDDGISYLSVCAVNVNSTGYGFYKKYGFHKIYSYGKQYVSLKYIID